MTQVPVSLVVLSHNRLEELSKNISRLLCEMHCPEEFQFIIVDNNSADGSRQFLVELQKENPEIRLVLNSTNLGVGGGRNSGFALAEREYIVALDDDTAIAAEDLRRVPELFKKYENAGLLAFKVIHPLSGELQNPHGDVACAVANHHGAGFAFQRFLYHLIGGIDEECDYGAEELDFAIRVHAQGMRVLYVPELTVYHNSLRRNPAMEQWRRIRRVYNNVRVYHKYFPDWMASRNSRRYVVVAMRSWLLTYGFRGMRQLLDAYQTGRKAGIARAQPVPITTVAFYNDPTLRPEFGNVPLWRKALKRH